MISAKRRTLSKVLQYDNIVDFLQNAGSNFKGQSTTDAYTVGVPALILCMIIAVGQINAYIADVPSIVRRHYNPRLACACGESKWET